MIAQSLRIFLRRKYNGQDEEKQAFFFVYHNDVVRIDVKVSIPLRAIYQASLTKHPLI